MYRPAMIVLPAPGSSASRNRSLGSRRKQSYTASSWCGSGWMFDTATAAISYAKATSIRRASTPSRNWSGSPSKRSSSGSSKIWIPSSSDSASTCLPGPDGPSK